MVGVYTRSLEKIGEHKDKVEFEGGRKREKEGHTGDRKRNVFLSTSKNIFREKQKELKYVFMSKS